MERTVIAGSLELQAPILHQLPDLEDSDVEQFHCNTAVEGAGVGGESEQIDDFARGAGCRAGFWHEGSK